MRCSGLRQRWPLQGEAVAMRPHVQGFADLNYKNPKRVFLKSF